MTANGWQGHWSGICEFSGGRGHRVALNPSAGQEQQGGRGRPGCSAIWRREESKGVPTCLKMMRHNTIMFMIYRTSILLQPPGCFESILSISHYIKPIR